MILLLNSPIKCEMPPAINSVANLGSHANGGRYTMTLLFYHATPQNDNEPLIKFGGAA